MHGIGQTRRDPGQLLESWLSALAPALESSGFVDVARSLGPGCDVQRVTCAFYADLFIRAGAQGAHEVDDMQSISPEGEQVEAQFAEALLSAAARRASDPRDRHLAAGRREQIEGVGVAQGFPGLLRPALEALSQFRWLAVGGVGFAGPFVRRSIREVGLYMTRPDIRGAVQQRVLDVVDADTRLVVAHSLGSVVAFEALHRAKQPLTFVTLGSPLGLRHAIYDRLLPFPPTVPTCVKEWRDYCDLDDLVAADVDLGPLFAPAEGSQVRAVSDSTTNNGSRPHDATRYLSAPAVARAIGAALRAVP